MARHKFNIPEDRAEDIAQQLAHKLAMVSGVQLYYNSDPDDVDLQKLMRIANTKIQTMIDSF